MIMYLIYSLNELRLKDFGEAIFGEYTKFHNYFDSSQVNLYSEHDL